jgi:hypothetical protein
MAIYAATKSFPKEERKSATPSPARCAAVHDAEKLKPKLAFDKSTPLPSPATSTFQFPNPQ